MLNEEEVEKSPPKRAVNKPMKRPREASSVERPKKAKTIESLSTPSQLVRGTDAPSKWSCSEVCEFVTRLIGSDVANAFRAHEIDGQALDYIRVETLYLVLKLKLGCAARIKSEFEKLKKRCQS